MLLQALQELGLDAVDLVDEESSVFQPTSLDQGEYNHVSGYV